MTMKHDRDTDAIDAADREDLDDKVDPLTAGWQTALGQRGEDTEREPDQPTADEVARGDDLETDRPD